MYTNDELESIIIAAIGTHQSLDMKKHLIEAVAKTFKQARQVEKLQQTNTKLNHEIGAYSGKVHLIAKSLLNLEKEMLSPQQKESKK